MDALAFFGDPAGRTLVDLGCGDGRASLFFARLGARVIAVDSSSVAIENLSHFCTENGITNLEPVCASAFDVASYGPADLVFGSMVLHHLEPFAEFGLVLRALMKADAKAFFYENNGRNPCSCSCGATSLAASAFQSTATLRSRRSHRRKSTRCVAISAFASPIRSSC